MARLRQLRDFIGLVQKIDVMQPTTCDLWPKSGQPKKLRLGHSRGVPTRTHFKHAGSLNAAVALV